MSKKVSESREKLSKICEIILNNFENEKSEK